MKFLYSQFLAATLLAGFAFTDTQAENSLVVNSDVPIVNISKGENGRNFVRLPDLEYVFQIETRCADELKPSSLLLSVADTRISLSENKLDANTIAEIRLLIPADQIAPVVIEEFCRQTEADSISNSNGVTQTTISAALSAQASLRCSDESQEKALYASSPLDVTLVCKSPPADAEAVQ